MPLNELVVSCKVTQAAPRAARNTRCCSFYGIYSRVSGISRPAIAHVIAGVAFFVRPLHPSSTSTNRRQYHIHALEDGELANIRTNAVGEVAEGEVYT